MRVGEQLRMGNKDQGPDPALVRASCQLWDLAKPSDALCQLPGLRPPWLKSTWDDPVPWEAGS